MIGYRLVNDDLADSAPAFIAILESLYSNELGLSGSGTNKVEDDKTEGAATDSGSSNKMTYGLFGLAAASIVGGIMMKTMKD